MCDVKKCHISQNIKIRQHEVGQVVITATYNIGFLAKISATLSLYSKLCCIFAFLAIEKKFKKLVPS